MSVSPSLLLNIIRADKHQVTNTDHAQAENIAAQKPTEQNPVEWELTIIGPGGEYTCPFSLTRFEREPTTEHTWLVAGTIYGSYVEGWFYSKLQVIDLSHPLPAA